MRKKRRKGPKCLNCDYQLDPAFEYCPSCGQENNNNQVSFKSLISDFFSNYFSLDSRFGRSFKPFFIQPGLLTKEFIDGKRVKYANPIRLYLVISLVHFFFFSIEADRKAKGEKGIIQFNNIPTSSYSQDSVAATKAQVKSPNASVDEEWFLSDEEFDLLIDLSADKIGDYSVEEISDSLRLERKSWMSRYILHQIIKVIKSDDHSLNMFLVRNIPITMFFILPLFGLILKLLFRKKLYINHLIHSLHLHSFAFMLLTIMWIGQLFYENFSDITGPFFIGGIVLYVLISMHHAYSVKWGEAIWKLILTSLLYIPLLVAGLITVALVSFLTF
ncbi:MAG: hypothetical protein ACI83W_001753 [Marinoscillum sp.]|jgi:hypothetical protein